MERGEKRRCEWQNCASEDIRKDRPAVDPRLRLFFASSSTSTYTPFSFSLFSLIRLLAHALGLVLLFTALLGIPALLLLFLLSPCFLPLPLSSGGVRCPTDRPPDLNIFQPRIYLLFAIDTLDRHLYTTKACESVIVARV